MAHECPDCGMTCHCGGDIDDCLFEGTQEQLHCSHCPDDDCDGDCECCLEESELLEKRNEA